MDATCERSADWPHAPVHRLSEAGTFFVTAGTYQKAHHFSGRERVAVLHRGLLRVAREHGLQLEAWAVFSNHYHFVAHSPPGQSAESLAAMLHELHLKTAFWVNKLDNAGSRKIWHNYWETRLTWQRSYFTRLSYVHRNAVKHGLVAAANQYPWCSAGWFERTASAAQVRSIYRFKSDAVKVLDEFESCGEW